MSVRGNINADFERLNDIIFTGALVINSIGYQIQGVFSQNVFNIYGDYGLAITALYEKDTGFQGTIKTDEIPLPFLPFFLTLDSEFQYRNRKDWLYTIENGYVSYATPASLGRTTVGLDFRGKADPLGLFLSEVKFGNEEALTGMLTITAPATDDDGETDYSVEMKLVSPDNTEQLDLAAAFNLSGQSIHADGSLKLDNISLARFLYTQGKTHIVSADAFFSISPDFF